VSRMPAWDVSKVVLISILSYISVSESGIGLSCSVLGDTDGDVAQPEFPADERVSDGLRTQRDFPLPPIAAQNADARHQDGPKWTGLYIVCWFVCKLSGSYVCRKLVQFISCSSFVLKGKSVKGRSEKRSLEPCLTI